MIRRILESKAGLVEHILVLILACLLVLYLVVIKKLKKKNKHVKLSGVHDEELSERISQDRQVVSENSETNEENKWFPLFLNEFIETIFIEFKLIKSNIY